MGDGCRFFFTSVGWDVSVVTGMKDAYLVLCHARPAQVNALAAYLREQGHDVFIHVDASSPEKAAFTEGQGIHLIEPSVKVEWADWSIAQATLRLMQAAVNTGREYRYLHLISGQCMPAMGPGQMEAFLDEAYARNLQIIESTPIPTPGKYEKWQHRVQVWYPRFMVSKYSPWHKWFWWYTNKWRRLRVKRPGWYLFRPFYGGAQWWSLTLPCVKDVLRYHRSHRLHAWFFRNVFCSDELYIQTCVRRCGYEVSGDNMRYLSWPFPSAPSPDDLTPADWPAVRESGCLFARKFALTEEECRSYLGSL